MSLAGQAFRLQKTDWEDPQILAEELYLILLTDVDPTLGPTSVATPGTDTPTSLPPDIAESLIPDLNLGALDFPVSPDNPLDQQQDSFDTPNEDTQSFFYDRERRTVTTEHERVVIPGLVTANRGNGRYDVTLYPNSSQAADTVRSVIQRNGTVTRVHEPEGSIPVEDVKQLDGSTQVPVGTYALIFRHTHFEITKIEWVQTGGSKPEKVLSTSTEVRVVARQHEMQAVVAASSCIPVQIVSGGPGSSYTANAYPDGLAGAAVSVTVTVLQLDPLETLPVGMWLLAAKIGGDYLVQPAIWVTG